MRLSDVESFGLCSGMLGKFERIIYASASVLAVHGRDLQMCSNLKDLLA